MIFAAADIDAAAWRTLRFHVFSLPCTDAAVSIAARALLMLAALPPPPASHTARRAMIRYALLLPPPLRRALKMLLSLLRRYAMRAARDMMLLMRCRFYAIFATPCLRH